ncbi:S-adenosyl-L-methionine-dependent methyltransferase [Radiomyces spectabilis]|uniref:S-adenosyl-L-methionine-dependent methyltransferase n=1 Tax=Radiomyces spectabilis TaxID=64574 RepID=UPI00221F3F34|nr:S-adenosyl-L-methionine-dependent methyltransferase [Radiomyces spectabilis]KAI8376092.1 S-adenosyl-L-methionine-dependent methyltransferase [Radiomyces spectabilis]
MSDDAIETFLKVFRDEDDHCHDEAETEPFPAYLEGIDTTLAPFCPTSASRVLKALKMAQLTRGDRLLDLGSGDGRFVTAAAAMGAARAVGVETDDALVDLSQTLAARVPNGEKTEFIQGDLLEIPAVREFQWTVIVLFLLPDHTDKFADLLWKHYENGARIVSLVFNLQEIPGLELQQADEPDGIYVYYKPPGNFLG